jgi:hypothetical protein
MRRRPYAFTERGVAMLSSVLHSERAVDVNIEIMRAFVRLRQMLASHEELARKLDALESVPGRVAPGDCSPGAPTDPYVPFQAYGSSYHELATGRLPE